MSLLQKLSWYRHRLAAMGPREIAGRVREKFRHLTESRGLAKLAAAKVTGEVRAFPVLPSRDAVPAEVKDAILADARRILDGEWEVLHGQKWKVSLPPVWHRDYLTGQDSPTSSPARKLNHRALPQGMDVRLIWETSRWIQVVRLAQAAWLSGEKSFADAALNILEDWTAKNPTGVGWNWTSPMEPGIRLINFAWTHALLSAAAETDKARLAAVTDRILPGHVWWVWRYHSIGSSANNHLLGELAGLLMALARWPQMNAFATGSEKIAAMQSRALIAQFAGDGGNREEALHYHLFAWEMGWQSTAAMKAAGVTVKDDVPACLAKAARCFAELVEPDEPWDFGDSDDAHITPFYVSESGALREWREWMLGGPGSLRTWLGAPPDMPAAVSEDGWTVFRESGYAIVRRDDWTARFDASALGFGSMAAHGHLDALHSSLWLRGQAVIVDPGTGGYFASKNERAVLTAREAHNGPHWPENELYPQRVGPFLWAEHHSLPGMAVRGGSVLGFLTLGGRKLIRSVTPVERGWKIEDSADDHGGASFQVNWQFAPGWTLDRAGAGEFTAVRGGQRIALRLSGEIEGEPRIEQALCSPSFRVLAHSPRLAVRARRLTTEILAA